MGKAESSSENMRGKDKSFAENPTGTGTAKELAFYVADMLHSLAICTKGPELRTLHTLIQAAEKEAKVICGMERETLESRKRLDMRVWRKN
jgi:hypothetical protein